MTRTLDNIIPALSQPFPMDVIQIKPGALTKDRQRALALVYVDPRIYMNRLDEVVGPDGWTVNYRTTPFGVICRLTILGITREDVGDFPIEPTDPNRMTSAAMQAFKRACAAFGLGRSLYFLEPQWFNYNDEKKMFTDPYGVIRTICEMAGYVLNNTTGQERQVNGSSSPKEVATRGRTNTTPQTEPPREEAFHQRLVTARTALEQAEQRTALRQDIPQQRDTQKIASNGATDPQLGLIARLMIAMQQGTEDEALAAAEAIDAVGDEFDISELSALTSKDRLRRLNLSKTTAHNLIERLKNPSD